MNKNASVARYNTEMKEQNGENRGVTLGMPTLTKLDGDLDDAVLDRDLDDAEIDGTLADAGGTDHLQNKHPT